MSDLVQSLAQDIMRHKRLYYNGYPEISDSEYDALEEQLRKFNPQHPALQTVGSEPSQNLKVKHDSPMLSLQKTYDVKDLYKWMGENSCVGSLKIDGNSLSVVYSKGQLKIGKTRGNGVYGENVTEKIRWVADIPNSLSVNDIEIRGELFCTESQFLKLCHEMQALGLERPTNPRNIVAGLLGRKTHVHLMRFFNFFAFEALVPGRENLTFDTEAERNQWLKSEGFRLPDPQVIKSVEEIDTYLKHVKTVMENGEIGVDGAVFSFNDLETHEQLGATAHHPRAKMSFKWQGETAVAKVRTISWSTSRLGLVTPVAVIDPVFLSGANITNVTLHNAEHVRQFNLKPGDKIKIVRSGEVIPKFLEVIKAEQGETTLPNQCPSCGAALDFDGIRLVCNNHEHCPAQKSGFLLNWIKSAQIDALSEKRLLPLMELGLVRTPGDLYRLSQQDLLRLPLTKEKMAKKLYENIQKTKQLPLASFLNGLGIAGAGLTTWEALISHHSSLEKILKLSADDLTCIDGFAEKSANQIVSGLIDRADAIKDLLEAGVLPISEEESFDSEEKILAGKQFVLTGTLSQPRQDIEKLIKEHGGKVTSSVSKNTFAVITSDLNSQSSKAKKARSLGVQVWTEDLLGETLNQED